MAFDNCLILAKKEEMKSRKLNFLKNFAFIDTLLDPQYERLLETPQVFTLFLNFTTAAPSKIFCDRQTNA